VPWGIIVPLVLAALLALLLALFVHRAARALARVRAVERWEAHRREVARAGLRLLAPVVPEVDAARRRAGDPERLQRGLVDAVEGLRELIERSSAPGGDGRSLVDALERAVRALELVRHGLAPTGSRDTGPSHQLEAQTAVKRGYLELLHARDALAERAEGVRRRGGDTPR
jgi:hypothetical protein